MAHSLQNISPFGHATGSRTGRRHNEQLPNGRKESRLSRVRCEPHAVFSRERSYAVKKARDVFLLPITRIRT